MCFVVTLMFAGLLSAHTLQEQDVCEFHGGTMTDCELTLPSGRKVTADAKVNECSDPPEVVFTLSGNQSRWKRVFVNSDESHIVTSMHCCLSLHMQLNHSAGYLHIQVSLSEKSAVVKRNFIDSVIKLPSHGSCGRIGWSRESVPFILFVILCALLLMVIIAIMVFRKRLFPSKSAQPAISVTSSSHKLIIDPDVPYLSEFDDDGNVSLESTSNSQSSTLVNNVIFRPALNLEESRLPMIPEEVGRFDSWAAYENVSVLEDEMKKSKRKKSKRTFGKKKTDKFVFKGFRG